MFLTFRLRSRMGSVGVSLSLSLSLDGGWMCCHLASKFYVSDISVEEQDGERWSLSLSLSGWRLDVLPSGI
jgi:hypothetical protein